MDTIIFISYEVIFQVSLLLPEEIPKGFSLNGPFKSYQMGCSFLLDLRQLWSISVVGVVERQINPNHPTS